MTNSLYSKFSEVTDTRQKNGLRHPLPSFLMMSTLGIMSGYTAMQELAVFFKSNESSFIEMFELKHGVPSYTQIRTILMGIDYNSLIKSFKEWVCQYVKLDDSDWLSADGKVLGSTVKDSQTSQQNFIAVVSLFAQKREIVLGSQIYHNKKGNEIAVAQNLLKELLAKLEVENIVIVLDALHCQKKQLPLLSKPVITTV